MKLIYFISRVFDSLFECLESFAVRKWFSFPADDVLMGSFDWNPDPFLFRVGILDFKTWKYNFDKTCSIFRVNHFHEKYDKIYHLKNNFRFRNKSESKINFFSRQITHTQKIFRNYVFSSTHRSWWNFEMCWCWFFGWRYKCRWNI